MPKNKPDVLSSFDRIRSAIELTKSDRVPVMPQITYACAKLTKLKFSEALTDPDKMAKALVAGYREIAYDGIYAGWESSFNLMAEAMGCRMRIPEDGVPSIEDNIVKQASDIDKVKIPDPRKDGRLPVHLQATRIIRQAIGKSAPIFSYVPGPLTLSGILRKTDALMMDLIKNTKFVHDLNKLSLEASKAYALAKIESGADIIVAGDPTASTTVLSPKMFEQFAFPYLKDLFISVSRAGAIPSLHICGQTTPILEKMADTGAKILELDYQVALKEAKSRVGSRVCIQGNVNPTGALLRGSAAAVLAESKKCISDAAAGGGYILSTGCEVPYEAKIANVKALVKAAKDFGRYDE
jgi:uroporphyrinogen decarboxylase